MKKIKLSDIDLKQEDLYQVDEGYFDALNKNILENNDASIQPIKSLATRNNPWYLGLAASLLILLLSIPIFLAFQQSSDELLSDISNDEIIYYLDFYDLGEQEAIEALGVDFYFDETFDLPAESLQEEELDQLYLEYGIIDI
ncbi:MAG: hypothetical protein ACI8QD_001145 [Cyclobacteriaceae bacterium]|jgi:hypothetical protein